MQKKHSYCNSRVKGPYNRSAEQIFNQINLQAQKMHLMHSPGEIITLFFVRGFTSDFIAETRGTPLFSRLDE